MKQHYGMECRPPSPCIAHVWHDQGVYKARRAVVTPRLPYPLPGLEVGSEVPYRPYLTRSGRWRRGPPPRLTTHSTVLWHRIR